MKTKNLFFTVLFFMVVMTIGCIEPPETEVLPTHTPIPITSFSTPVPVATITTPISADISKEEFIDRYIEARELFIYESYETELKANESENLADAYLYDSEQLKKARTEYHKATELYIETEEQNLQAQKLFENLYEKAPTEYYKELCELYIIAAQSNTKMASYMSSVMRHMEKACEYYEKGDLEAGDDEIIKGQRKTIQYNMEIETFNMTMEKIKNIEFR